MKKILIGTAITLVAGALISLSNRVMYKKGYLAGVLDESIKNKHSGRYPWKEEE